MKLRRTTSLTTLLSFILLLVTSIILYVTPQGKIAFWANWKMLGLSKEQWGALHMNLGILFVVAGLIHTLLNMKAIVSYFKNKTQKFRVFNADFNAALIITLFVTLFTLFELPPVKAVQALNSSLKDAAAKEYGEPPYGHAEASTLTSFCKRTGLNLQNALEQLEKAGFSAVSAEATLAEMADANGIPPQKLYEAMLPVQTGAVKMPSSPGSGFGRKTLSGICAEVGLDVEQVISGLKRVGIEISAESTMKDAAEQNNTEPFAIYEAIRTLK